MLDYFFEECAAILMMDKHCIPGLGTETVHKENALLATPVNKCKLRVKNLNKKLDRKELNLMALLSKPKRSKQ